MKAADPNIRRTMAEVIDQHAATKPDAPAIVFGDETRTYAALADRSKRVAAGLVALGVASGDRIALWMPNRLEWIEVAIAAARLGAIIMSTNSRFRAGEVSDILERSQAKVLVIAPSFQDGLHIEILAEVPKESLAAIETIVVCGVPAPRYPESISGKKFVTYDSLLKDLSAGLSAVAAESPWFLFTTSGTTKKPKFVIHSQASVVSHSTDIGLALQFARGAVFGVPHPLSGMLGFTPMFAALVPGIPMVLSETFEPADVVREMRKHKVTNLLTIDDGLTKLLESAEGSPAFPDFRYALTGVFKGSVEDFIQFADARGVRSLGAFGMTEIQGMFSMQRVDGSPRERAPGGGYVIGRNVRVRVRDLETGEILPPGRVGELEVLTPNIMLGYFGDEAATKAAFTDDGYFKTGDSVSLDADDRINFVARIGDTLRLSGFLVSPLEISTCIEAHPSISGCEVVGAMTSAGMRPVAFVIPAPGAAFDEAAVVTHCLAHLAKFKIPVKFVLMEAFPTRDAPNGPRILRTKLREMAAELNL